ncbi:MAG: M23 family metallopeptidase [Elusimicrobia bacterium]|nr:M23 family metallopeptidase [Elusimicrobiota bacterium]
MKRGILGAVLLIPVMSGLGHALRWPLANSNGPHSITGTLGEYRDTLGFPHFHDGVDITTAATGGGSSVHSVLAGTVAGLLATGGGSNFVKVRSTASAVIFVYVHVNPDAGLSVGDSVAEGEEIGQINNAAPPHIHFKQTNLAETQILNSLMTPGGGLSNYADTMLPQVSSVIVFNANSGAQLDISSPVAPGNFRIRAKAKDLQSLGSSNVGIFSIGYQLFNADSNTLYISAFPRQAYSLIEASRIDSPEIAYDTTASQGSGSNFNFYYFANNMIGLSTPLELSSQVDRNLRLCVLAKDVRGNGGNVAAQQGAKCESFRIDGTMPSVSLRKTDGTPVDNNGATNETSIVVAATDTFGLQKFVLSGPTSSTETISGALTHTHTFGSLTANSTTPYVVEATSGVFSMRLERSSGVVIAITTFEEPVSTAAWAGPFCQLSSGTYSLFIMDKAGNQSRYDFEAATETFTMTLTADGPGWSDSGSAAITQAQTETANWAFQGQADWCVADKTVPCMAIETHVAGTKAACEYYANCGFTSKIESTITFGPPWQSSQFTIANTTDVEVGGSIAMVASPIGGGGVTLTYPFGLNPGQVITGDVDFPQNNSSAWRSSVSASGESFEVLAPIANIDISSTSTLPATMAESARRNLLRLSSPKAYDLSINGGSGAFGTTTTISVSYADAVMTDTMTLQLYRWERSQWRSSGLTNQSVSKSTSGIISIVARSTSTSWYAAFSLGVDTTAPTTSWGIQGSSYGFAGIIFVSTYSYLILSSTDPMANGFASGMATIYYRLDGLSGDPFTTYSSSLSLLPGTHWVDYYAVDWAANMEAVKRATITVTSGSVTRLSGDLQVDGNLLVGFLGSGAKAEVLARAEYDYALKVSSVDGRAMMAVDSANFVSIGTAPASGRLTLAGVTLDSALALRSGNSTASISGAQLAFGFDGSPELRHALYTQHGSAANFNKMVFELWTPASGSSSTLGNQPVLSLEGSTITSANALVHIRPAGIADKELVVSNGIGMGEGNVLRWERWTPSSIAIKKDISRLGRADEEKAWADIAALKPSVYRRKRTAEDGSLVADHTGPLERGYIFEETPESIRAGPGAVSIDERLINAELALKAAMRRIEELKARIKKAKERGR